MALVNCRLVDLLIALRGYQEAKMKVQFEWRFDDEAEGKRKTTPAQRSTARKDNSRRPSELVWRYRRQAQNGVPIKGTVFDVGLTANQRRLHAALARVKPWLCPCGQPAALTRYTDS